VGEFGRLDAIIANSGNVFNAPVGDWPSDRFESLLRHHLLGAFHVVRPGFEVMKRAGFGRIVLVAYLAGETCTQTQTVFSAFMGHVAALQIGITRGWTAADGSLSAEDVAAHIPEILDATGLLVPRTL
jgi:NAD(P)-dependent dehydrogenase (short-subunit alcohol dehydrogenase family)